MLDLLCIKFFKFFQVRYNQSGVCYSLERKFFPTILMVTDSGNLLLLQTESPLQEGGKT